MTQFDCLATLCGRQRAPETVNARGLHPPQILDMLGATKFDLKKRRVVIDVESLKFPENDGGILGSKLLISAIVIKRSRQDRIALPRGKPLKSADAGLQLHLLGQLGEMTFRLCRRQTSAFLQDRYIELKYAMGTYPECSVGILIGDFEVVAQILLTTEFTGFDRRFVIDCVFGKGPLAKGSRQGSSH